MKRAKIELWSLGIACVVTALGWPSNSPPQVGLSAEQARVEAASYLDQVPRTARLDARASQWAVSDGEGTARLDARTGELLEIEFRPEP